MSSIFVKLNKQYSGVKVVAAEKVFIKNPKTGKRDKLNPNLDIIGKYDMDYPGAILKANKDGCKTAFIDDVNELTKTTKSDLVNFFFDKNGKRNKRRKAYLVRTDKKSRTSEPLKSDLKQGRKRGK